MAIEYKVRLEKTYELVRKSKTLCSVLENGDWECMVEDNPEDVYTIKKENQKQFELKETYGIKHIGKREV